MLFCLHSNKLASLFLSFQNTSQLRRMKVFRGIIYGALEVCLSLACLAKYLQVRIILIPILIYKQITFIKFVKFSLWLRLPRIVFQYGSNFVILYEVKIGLVSLGMFVGILRMVKAVPFCELQTSNTWALIEHLIFYDHLNGW